MRSKRFFKIERLFKSAASELDYTFYGLDCDQCDGNSMGYILDDGTFISSKRGDEILDLSDLYIEEPVLLEQENLIKVYNSLEFSSEKEIDPLQKGTLSRIMMDCTRNCFDPNENSEVTHYIGGEKIIIPIKEFLEGDYLSDFMQIQNDPQDIVGDDAATPGREIREFNSDFEEREKDASDLFPEIS
jgi:hypothetical protein